MDYLHSTIHLTGKDSFIRANNASGGEVEAAYNDDVEAASDDDVEAARPTSNDVADSDNMSASVEDAAVSD